MNSSYVKFDKQALFNDLFSKLSSEQTLRLIEYAKDKVIKIGSRIQEYSSKNNLDRTGNLLNSLCWFVSYGGNIQASGFYREEIYHNRGIGGGQESWLHEFLPDSAEIVQGRSLANDYIAKHQGGNGSGWKVSFAILAPYWAYWEQGFKMKSGGGNSPIPRSTRFIKFAVMSEFFDELRADLKPRTNVTYTISVPKYSYKNNKYRGKNRRVGYKKLMNTTQYQKHLGRK